MKKSCLFLLSKLLVLLTISLLLNQSAYANGYQTSKYSSGIACPEGFHLIPSGLACTASNFTATVNVIPPQDCPEGFERPPGVRFCIAENFTLEIQNDVMLIAKRVNGDCPEGLSRAVGSTICTANDLVLKLINNEVVLSAHNPRCPAGFHKPDGIRFCIPKNFALKTLPPPPPPECPLGFIKPPGVHFCIANNILYKDENRQNDLIPPIGECPDGWHKPRNSNFCVPSNEISECGSECANLKFKAIKMVNNIDDFKLTPCPKGTVEHWWDMPVFDSSGLFVIDYIPARSCIPEGQQPSG